MGQECSPFCCLKKNVSPRVKVQHLMIKMILNAAYNVAIFVNHFRRCIMRNNFVPHEQSLRSSETFDEPYVQHIAYITITLLFAHPI